MKLRAKIVLLSLLPAFFVSLLHYGFSTSQMDKGILNEAYDGMQATAIAITSLLDTLDDGEYQVKDGELYKGDVNLSKDTAFFNSLKEKSGFDATFFFGDTRYLTTLTDTDGKQALHTKASDTIISEVLEKGNEYQSNDTDIFGVRYVCYYLPVYQPGTKDIAGILFLGEPYENLHAIIHDTKTFLGLFTLIMTIISTVVVYAIAYKLVQSITKSISYVTMMEEGRLGFQMEENLLTRKDVIGDMCRSIKGLEKNLRSIINNIQEQCKVLDETANYSYQQTKEAISSVMQIDKNIQGIANLSNFQASNAMLAGDSVSAMGNMIEETGTQVDNLTDTTNTMSEASNQAKEILKELNENMRRVQEAVRIVSEQTSQTHISVQEVSKTTTVITEIASQTTLLSLNASIEAARAGEQGKGFAVVASEIQQLAEQSNKAAEEIQTILRKLCDDSDSSVATMNEVEAIIKEQDEKISNTNAIFQTVENNIENSIHGIMDIKTKTHALDETREKTVQAVQDVASSSQETAANTEETATFTDEVTSKVSEIETAVNNVRTVIHELGKSIEVFSLNN